MRYYLPCLIASLMLMPELSAAPDWWERRAILLPAVPVDDFAVINQGQLKNIARLAALEMQAQLPGGSGQAVQDMIEDWNNVAEADDYAAVNLGQLRAVAQPFHDRLFALGLTSSHPWAQASSANNYALANIGQVKAVFSFDIPLNNSPLPNQFSSIIPRTNVGTLAAGLLKLDDDDWESISLSAHDRARFGLTNANFSAASGQILHPDSASRLVKVSRFPDTQTALQIINLDAESNVTAATNP